MAKYKSFIILTLVSLFAGFVGAMFVRGTHVEYQSNTEVREIDSSPEKIEEVKQRIVEDLASKCEVQGVPEGSQNGKTIMDTNGYYSRGRWMFQTKTVQYYYDKLYSKDITVDEAILIAHTEDKARQLAYDIIWNEVGGVWNWENCTYKLGLADQITIIRELEAKQ